MQFNETEIEIEFPRAGIAVQSDAELWRAAQNVRPIGNTRVVRPGSIDEVAEAVRGARSEAREVIVATGGDARATQHAESGNTGAVILDLGRLNRPLHLDIERGTVEVEAGMTLGEVARWLREAQAGEPRPWVLPLGFDAFSRRSAGELIASGATGRALKAAALRDHVERLAVVNESGQAGLCSRELEADIFDAATGPRSSGQGSGAVICAVSLRLERWSLMRRSVGMTGVSEAIRTMESLARDCGEGGASAELLLCVDDDCGDFMRRGVLIGHESVQAVGPVGWKRPMPDEADVEALLFLWHADKRRAWQATVRHLRATDGEFYGCDTISPAGGLDDLRADFEHSVRALGGDLISAEIEIAGGELAEFLTRAGEELWSRRMDVVRAAVTPGALSAKAPGTAPAAASNGNRTSQMTVRLELTIRIGSAPGARERALEALGTVQRLAQDAVPAIAAEAPKDRRAATNRASEFAFRVRARTSANGDRIMRSRATASTPSLAVA